MSSYAVVIEDAGLNYSAYVPDLPGCISVGATVEEATKNIHDAIELYIAAMIEYGSEVPRPSSQVAVVEVAL
jgi:predicted RNase H-like HicB family nuclease